MPAVIPKPLAFAAIGPLIDGHVEIPLGSGNRFAADGMLSQHPQYIELCESAKKAGVPYDRDVPLVIDHFATLGMLYHCGDVAFVNRRGMKIESIFHVNAGHAYKVVGDYLASQRDEMKALVERDLMERMKEIAAGLPTLAPSMPDAITRAMDADYRRMATSIGIHREPPVTALAEAVMAATDFATEIVERHYRVRPCYRCDARTEVTGDVPLCARCRAET